MGERKPRGPGSPEGFPGGLTQPCPQGRRPEKKECPKGRILVLGKHRSSVSREYRRGKTVNRDSQLREFPVYSAQKAQEAAGQAALNKGPRPRLTTGIAERIRDLILRERLSPYAAVMRLRACGDLPWGRKHDAARGHPQIARQDTAGRDARDGQDGARRAHPFHKPEEHHR